MWHDLMQLLLIHFLPLRSRVCLCAVYEYEYGMRQNGIFHTQVAWNKMNEVKHSAELADITWHKTGRRFCACASWIFVETAYNLSCGVRCCLLQFFSGCFSLHIFFLFHSCNCAICIFWLFVLSGHFWHTHARKHTGPDTYYVCRPRWLFFVYIYISEMKMILI